ncbi:hypothetical protein [Ectopseudomonas alcaliphila]|uniref:Uncharacterized protein n=1 Tax=Ectopseudomonas alcaliphila TaxID=101564 RepID=A0ABU4Q2Q3_9GAMM|nr:hypothetical protein [Pseudomonas alcaliphila]MDX5994432.1 hypothetical protein [Pseudomonas alcaliphila]
MPTPRFNLRIRPRVVLELFAIGGLCLMIGSYLGYHEGFDAAAEMIGSVCEAPPN